MDDTRDVDVVMSALINFPSMAAVTVLQSIHTVGRKISVMIAAKKTDINDLPDEMLREILLFVMEPPSEPQPPQGMLHLISPVFSPVYPITPFPLTQVCRRWRTIACKTRALWRSITITHPKLEHIHRVKLWLEYGQGYSLDIVLHQSDRLPIEEYQATHAILTLLVQCVDRWNNIEFHFTQNDIPPLLAQHITRISHLPSPVLRTAVISHMFQTLESPGRVRTIWNSLGAIPSLNHIEWLSVAPVAAPSSTLLHTLVSAGFDFATFIEALRLCPNLREVDVRLRDAPVFGEDEETQIRFKHLQLRRLAVTGHQKDLKTFLYLFTFPSLTSIELDTIDASACRCLWKLLRRSRCVLTKLMLQVDNAQGLDVAGWFEQDVLANLETLVISGVEINDHVLLMLTCPPLRGNRPKYFEKLKYLSLSDTLPGVDDGVLLRMLGSRFWTPQDAPPKTELITAAVRVFNKSNAMNMYEKMINACAKRMAYSRDENWRFWKNRSLKIEEL